MDHRKRSAARRAPSFTVLFTALAALMIRSSLLLLLSHSHAVVAAAFTRRGVINLAAASTATASTSALSSTAQAAQPLGREEETVLWGPFKDLSSAEILALETTSTAADAGYLLPNGVRVIDLIPGDGPQPRAGDRIYCHYKVWSNGFRDGPVADWTYLDGRPYDWTLGQPTDRIPAAVDVGVAGMREGGWRRLVVPAAYGNAGLRRINPIKGGGRYTPPKAGFVIKPNTVAY